MTKKKRIMLISRNLGVGGIQRLVVDIADKMADIGHEVHVVYMKPPRELNPKNENVKVHFLNINKINRFTIIGFIYDIFTRLLLRPIFPGSTFFWRGLYGSPIFYFFLKSLERKRGKFDIIIARGHGAFEHIWLYNSDNYFQFVECPQNLSQKGILYKIYTWARFSDKNTIAISSGVLDLLQQYLDKFNIKARSLNVISNPLPIDNIKKLADEKMEGIPEHPYIVNVARLCPQKNIELLLQAYKLSNIKHRLVIVGSGEDEVKSKKLAVQLGIKDKVFFVGQQSNPYPWMKHADLFILSSKYEGFGLVLVESLACGTPVVAVDCPGGIRDILIEEQLKYICKNNPESLAKMIEYAIENPIRIKEDWYMRFDINRIIDQFINLSSIRK